MIQLAYYDEKGIARAGLQITAKEITTYGDFRFLPLPWGIGLADKVGPFEEPEDIKKGDEFLKEVKILPGGPKLSQ